MGKAKDILLKPIPTSEMNPYMRKWHYSGKVDTRTQLSIGVYYQGKLEGGLQFGPSIDKHKVQGLVDGTGWNEWLDLHRLAFTDNLPRNSESRAISIAMKLLRRYAPHVKWVLSYADAAQCGDGTIYRAAGFVLTGIRENNSMWQMPDGEVVCSIVLEPSFGGIGLSGIKRRYGKTGGENAKSFLKRIGAKPIPGYQLRYIYFLDPTYRERLTVPELPYSEIDRVGARMYKGERITSGRGEIDSAPHTNEETGGASPTRPLLVNK